MAEAAEEFLKAVLRSGLRLAELASLMVRDVDIFNETVRVMGKGRKERVVPVGALALDGWDTHANEGALDGRLSALLGALDGAIAAIETNMGDAWRESVVQSGSPFARAVRM